VARTASRVARKDVAIDLDSYVPPLRSTDHQVFVVTVKGRGLRGVRPQLAARAPTFRSRAGRGLDGRVVVVISIALVQPLLLLALQLVVEDNSVDLDIAHFQTLSDIQIRLVDMLTSPGRSLRGPF
jgi:hypothetical protein